MLHGVSSTNHRARKALAAESSQHHHPTRSLLPLILRVDQTVGEALTSLAFMRVQSAPLVQMHRYAALDRSTRTPALGRREPPF